MKFGVIGAGAIGQAVAGHVLAQGHDVILSNSRGAASLEALAAALGPHATAGEITDAAKADIVLLAVPWAAVPAAVQGVQDWDGRIVIDATNQFLTPPPNPQVADLGELTGSEYIASLIPGASVVKAFNTLFSAFIDADPRHPAGQQLLFLAGDDHDAKQQVSALVESIGFAVVDLGGLRDGGSLMQAGTGPLSGLHVLKQKA